MQKKKQQKARLAIANDNKSPFEIYSIILKGVMSSLNSIFISYYVSENIEALMKYINDKRIISAEEYKRLLAQAKDFYAVIICALFINPIRKQTKNFKLIEMKSEDKSLLFIELQRELSEFFIEWLCDVQFNPLLYYRLGCSYSIGFNLELSIKAQGNSALTPLENQILKIQMIEIMTVYIIEEVAVQLGLAGLDYIDLYKAVKRSANNSFIKSLENCIDTI